MKIRIAKPQDADELAEVHFTCSANQAGGFMFELGLSFFREYYRILLREKNSLVVCSEDESGEIIGLISGSLETEEHLKALRQHKLHLLISSIYSLLHKPHLVMKILTRMRAGSASEDQGFIVTSGTRLEYWGWLPHHKQKLGAVELLRTWLSIVSLLGVRSVRLEVDVENIKSVELHRLLGSKIIKEYNTPEGKRRLLMEYILEDKSAHILKMQT